jgi:phage terminase large subunit GpA-like protein
MIAISCARCNRRFTPTTEEIHAYLTASQGQKHGRVLCPHCGRDNKIARERLQEAVRFARPAPIQAVTTPAEAAPTPVEAAMASAEAATAPAEGAVPE